MLAICIPIVISRVLVGVVIWIVLDDCLLTSISVPAMSVNCATAFIAIVAATVLRFILVRLNNKLDRGEEVEGAVPGEGSRRGFRFLV